MDAGEYCRELESYLCRRNGGHLIRIAGPAFEMVRGWAEQGIPLKVAFRGIDRAVERREAKASRRPLRIEFCEADVLDAFDEWRRAVGVGAMPEAATTTPAVSLPAHLQRVLQKLTTARATCDNETIGAAIDRAIDTIETIRPGAARLRGTARADAIDRLGVIERELLAAAREALPRDTLDALGRVAEEELGAFAARMKPDAYRRACAAAVDRLLRERLGLPKMSFFA